MTRTKQKPSSALQKFKALRTASKRPLPTEMGDGRYAVVANRPGLRDDLGRITMDDIRTLVDIISEKLSGRTQQDDKTMLMERTIQLVSGLPDHSKTQEILTNNFIDKLWNSLDHPPMIYVGPESKYRHPDGYGNNPVMPELGMRGHKYARSCAPKTLQLGAQPDPEAVFEAVMARSGFRQSSNNVSSILWYWATIIIHDIFWTDMHDQNKNNTSSYLDLAPLYGNSQEAQNSIRTFKDGKLKVDTFADKRMIGNPPGVCILLIMFNRFHNHVATTLADINEGGRFPKPTPEMSKEDAAKVWKKYDEEIFQTARLVTSGLYINITLIDYVRNIVNLNRADTTWTLDPRQEMGVAVGTKEGSEAGVGNVVSAEFNLCYRWHSCISEMDEKWIEKFFGDLVGEDHYDPDSVDVKTLMMAMKKFEMSIPEDPAERTFNGFERGLDGRFDDDELMEALATAIEQPGGAFGARNVPRVMKPVEMMGIIRGRRWNLAGLNEFRKHFGMKAYDTFEEINSDPDVADQLRNLYQHPDNVELYPGIVAEEAKAPMVPGVGITPTYTISRVILSDAVSLVRGDRYYTNDYHAGNLTNWGFREVEYDFNINHGCVFYKLFIRAFPNHFKGDSVYAHYPMVTPEENKRILKSLKRDGLFSFDRPKFSAPRTDITSYGAAKKVLRNQENYKVDWQEGLGFLMGDSGRKFMLSGDSKLHSEQRRHMHSLLYTDGWRESVKAFYSATAEHLLSEKGYKIAGKSQVDIVRDVGNLVHTHFAAHMFNIPLKTRENPKGVFTEQELYQALSVIFTCIFFDIDPAKSFPLRQAAKEAADKIGGAVEMNVKLATMFGISGLFTSKSGNDPLSRYGVNMAKGLKKSGLSAHDIAWSQILPTAAAMVPNQAQVANLYTSKFAQALDWYLSPEGQPYLEDIRSVAAKQSSPESDALLLGYAMEGIRMAGTFGLYRKAEKDDTILEDDGREVKVNAGDRVFMSFVSAAKDAKHFPEPDRVNPERPLDSYIHYGDGPHICLGREISQVALTELFRVVFRKKNLRRAPGLQGMLKKVPRPGGFFVYMTEDWGSLWPWPTTMKIMWDE
ncbi:linoleate 10R-lipoxygenase [Geosmithia morbida]|uniref:Linoleate 10R-lipoxygenase n=1 Tax=Geosmithia morbida TaxID=1094350 RepID=A0A9P5D982_9HYPO|nr:linoleate 10R-lipoxygenase [Geosmithia morbida]KAF4126244.1 linoleate 10R-lipoxygenase [Geosmithia morbida]